VAHNDQGDENGGLVFDGGMKNGKLTNGGSLTFDRWHQDQTLQLVSTEDGRDRRAGLVVNDRPDAPMDIAAGLRMRKHPAMVPDPPGRRHPALPPVGFPAGDSGFGPGIGTVVAAR
jgi:hypothetical protein